MIKEGTRVEFLGWGEQDQYCDLSPGTCGTVVLTDSNGTIDVKWDDGHRIGLLTQPMYPGQRGFRPDRFRVLEASVPS